MQLSGRYLKFDLRQLLKVAVAAVSNEGARYCVSLHDLFYLLYSSLTRTLGTIVLKCREALNNKAYLLTMDNGLEVFSKLPNPIAGPAYYTTASEVATREFVRPIIEL
jgi:hypothetical protein